jgi:hypothetical protein
VDMGRMKWMAPQAMAHVMTTAQLFQCLPRVDGLDRDGQMLVLKASVRSWMERAGPWSVGAMFAQLPSAASRAVGAAVLSRMWSAKWPPKTGAADRACRFVKKGIPKLWDHVALFPKSGPRQMRTVARKASWAGRGTRFRLGGMLRATCAGRESGVVGAGTVPCLASRV